MPGKRDADRGVELADVDPELERVGRDHAEQLAGAQPPLDLLPLGGRVAAAVGRDPLGELGLEPVGRVAEDQLDPLARLHEADRPGAARRSARRTARPPRTAPRRGCPSSSSSSGGFHIATRRAARGARVAVDQRGSPSRPVSRSASSTGLAIVALASRKRGSVPWIAATRRSRRSTLRDVRAEHAAVRRAPRRRPRTRGSRTGRPRRRGGAGSRRGACRGWSGSGCCACGSPRARRAACRRRRSRGGSALCRPNACSARAWSWASALVGYR